MSDQALLLGISAAYLVVKLGNSRRSKRSKWIRGYFKKRNFEIVKELQLDNDILFKNFTRMSRTNFLALLKIIERDITKKNTHYRDAIPAEIKLVITLRYLATGDSFSSIAYLMRVSKQFISHMLPEVLKAIVKGLRYYVKLPSSAQQWKAIAEDYHKRWNFPHCIGALDGKHVILQKPENSVSEFHNYKGTESIVLLGIVDANYRFIYVNVGCQGRISDGGVFSNTSFCKKLLKNELNLPDDDALPGRQMPVPYVLVADSAFSISRNVLKPYAVDLNRGSPKRVFNYRLSRARRMVENAFGLLASVFRVFRKPIEIKIEKTVIDIVLACVYLHNFLRSQPDSKSYSNKGCFDNEDSGTGEIIPGSWRQVVSSDSGYRPLRSIPRRPSAEASAIRDEYTSYFMSDFGAVPFQKRYL